ncbi:hypothetical protein GFL93_23485 [Rhizobium leguminosarum bv. viciae]|uniref:Uncharacterized protein n=1 Tax=Rhizobium leguminosarum bv. viciae TaxID=387 RepID=A0A8G2J2E9_RHILV|nr:hypothetical protein [Rhizobium leguminosarum bv. viciae]TBF83365.1 hypothetical protein ELG86_15070 [Rhizobium leguminosarum]NKK19223.1 hypothetical protein [Rhizobium leguminosarum bv. viciae]NKL22614.1 hypothetical protein [Rhizobium leguminosarum bv. viciae]TBF99739.1 hypothetical protein ELG85_13830 [Rhizobium leguminosarum]
MSEGAESAHKSPLTEAAATRTKCQSRCFCAKSLDCPARTYAFPQPLREVISCCPSVNKRAASFKHALSLPATVALDSASSSALSRGSAAPVADTRDKPEHDEKGVR